MEDKLQEIEHRFERLTADLGNPEVIGDRARFSQVAKERSQLEPLVETFREYKRVKAETGDGDRRCCGDADRTMREPWRAGSCPRSRRRPTRWTSAKSSSCPRTRTTRRT